MSLICIHLFICVCDFSQALALGEDRVIPGIKAGEEASLPGRKTVETERAAERIMEAVEVHKEVSQQLAEYRDKLDAHQQSGRKDSEVPAAPQLHPLMVAYDTTDPDKYLLKVLRQVKSSEVEETLLVLPLRMPLRWQPVVAAGSITRKRLGNGIGDEDFALPRPSPPRAFVQHSHSVADPESLKKVKQYTRSLYASI